MRVVFIVGLVGIVGCATGIAATGDDTPVTHNDGGTKPATSKDAAATPDTGSNFNNNTNNDSGSGQPDAGTTNTCTGTMCGTTCVDTTTDDNNCGACSKTCPTGATCQSSSCVCGTGTLCTGACVDTTSDNSNCGACGKKCTASQTCTGGKCTTTSTAPPKGSCSHDLCTTGTYLSDGCDTTSCTSLICDGAGDAFCCSSLWDATCVSEVTMYCAPYSCP